MRVVRGERRQLRREDRGERMFVLGPIHAQHRFHAGDGRRLERQRPRYPRPTATMVISPSGMPRGAGDALRRGGIQGLAVVFADDEYLVH